LYVWFIPIPVKLTFLVVAFVAVWFDLKTPVGIANFTYTVGVAPLLKSAAAKLNSFQTGSCRLKW
jgi:hypothetical protein